MDAQDFHDGLKTDHDKEEEWAASAEHLVRLKRQPSTRPEPSEPVEKEASVADEVGGDLTLLADRLKSRLQKQASIVSRVKDMDPLLAAITGAGVIGGGVGTYMSSRPKKELGGRSSAERDADVLVRGQQGEPESGFLEKMKNRTTENSRGYAKVMREHPGKSALLGGALGGLGAHSVARLLGAGGNWR